MTSTGVWLGLAAETGAGAGGEIALRLYVSSRSPEPER
jgi:hypothetical protein